MDSSSKAALETATPDQRPVLFSAAFVLLLVVQFLYGTAYSTAFLLPKYLLETRNADATLIGNAHGAYAIAGALAVAFIGPWIDHFGRRPIMLAGLVLAILSYAPLGLATSTPLLLGLRALHGLSFAMVFGAGSALAVDLAPSARRAEAVGYFGTAMLITNGFGPAIAEALAQRVSWSAVFVSCSVYCVGALWAALALREPHAHRRPQGSPSYAVPLSWPLAGAYLAALGVGIGVGVSKTFIPAVLVAEGASQVTPQFVLYTAGALLQRIVFGWMPDRFGRLRATVASLLLYALALAITAAVSVAWIPLIAVVLGMAHGVAYPAATALTADLSSAAQRGRTTAWFAGFFNLGFAVAATGLPQLSALFDYRGMIAVGAALLGVTALFVARWARTLAARGS